MQSIDKQLQWYLSKFDAFERSLNGDKSTQVHAMRRSAIRRFAEIGFPTMKQEEWRYTNISQITKIEFQPIHHNQLNIVTESDILPYILPDSVRLVFINGTFSSELSNIGPLPAGVSIGSLAATLKKHPDAIYSHINHLVAEENAFTALNTAFLSDGAFVLVPEGIILNRPIQLLFIASSGEQIFAAQPRNLINAGEKSKFKIIETYVGLAKDIYLTNAITELVIGEHSVVEHDRVQIESLSAYHIGATHVRMNAGSTYTSNVVSLGGSIVRHNITAVLDAEGVECTLNGLSIGSGTQLIDNHTFIDHAKPHCSSHELYKSILNEESKGVFNGKIFVRKDAQQTDAKQTNKTLLLSDEATINTKPQLEILADDVKCTHGATVGQLDAEQIFYLRSRGIDIAAAQNILTSAFANDVVNRITIEPLRLQVERMISDRLNKNQ
jgi:Fe-S cluster assembly protein SufD